MVVAFVWDCVGAWRFALKTIRDFSLPYKELKGLGITGCVVMFASIGIRAFWVFFSGPFFFS